LGTAAACAERFLAEHAPAPGPGAISFEGRTVGEHRGYPYYTIGQRSGIGAHGERMYVSGIDAASNTVSIGRSDDLYRRRLTASGVNLIAVEEIRGPLRVDAQVRYRDTPAPATLFPESGSGVALLFDEPKRAIAPGQSVVFYEGETLIGGGVIETASG